MLPAGQACLGRWLRRGSFVRFVWVGNRLPKNIIGEEGCQGLLSILGDIRPVIVFRSSQNLRSTAIFNT
jgi:hypothetical protein